MSVATFRARTWRYSKPVLIGLVVGVVVLVIARIAATPALKWYVNNKLDESPDYAGQVGDIDLRLLAGSYTIDNVEIVKTTGDVPVPLFAAREVEFSLVWKALFDGAAVGEAELWDPQINIVDSDDEAMQQTGAGGHWLSMIDDLFPLKLDHAVIHNGQLHFRNYDAEPKMDIFLTEMEVEAENLATREELTDSPVATVRMAAKAMQASDLTLGAAFNPNTEKPTFDVNAKLTRLPILELDNFIRTYAPFDVEAGEVDVVTELASRDGGLVGYVKPIIYNLDVFSWKEDIKEDHDNPLRALWEGLIDGVAELLENQPRDQVASYIPLQGDVSNPDTNVFVAVAGIFKNAFVQAFRADLENTVSLFSRDNEIEKQVSLPAPLTPADLQPELSERQQKKESQQQAEVHEEVRQEVREETGQEPQQINEALDNSKATEAAADSAPQSARADPAPSEGDNRKTESR